MSCTYWISFFFFTARIVNIGPDVAADILRSCFPFQPFTFLFLSTMPLHCKTVINYFQAIAQIEGSF